MAETFRENYASADGPERYVNDLADMQTYLNELQQLVAVSRAEAENSEDCFLYQIADDDKLTALRVKEQQLAGMRAHVMRTPNDSISQLMREMLDVVEPQCRNMIQTLSELRGEKSPPAADEQLTENDELVMPLERVSLTALTVPGTNDEEAGDSSTLAARPGHISHTSQNIYLPICPDAYAMDGFTATLIRLLVVLLLMNHKLMLTMIMMSISVNNWVSVDL